MFILLSMSDVAIRNTLNVVFCHWTALCVCVISPSGFQLCLFI